MKKLIILLLLTLLFSCNQGNKEGQSTLNQNNFGSIYFEATDNWIEYKHNDWSITYVDFEDTCNYKANFTIMILDTNLKNVDNFSLDNVVNSNLRNLKEVYLKLNIISYDTNSINNYESRKVSFASLTNNKEIIGTVLYLIKSKVSLIMVSFQGANKGGVFEKRLKEVEEIANSIKFKYD